MNINTQDAALRTGAKLEQAVMHSVSEDLSRLDQILSDAIERLTSAFAEIQALSSERGAKDIERAAYEAVTALQFQDMASQLIAHCRRKLASPEDGDSAVPFSATHFTTTQILRHVGPVSQSHVGEGSIDLF